ncbi:MAG: 2-hydroxyacid dehydrogenase [Alkalilacustris sp.]
MTLEVYFAARDGLWDDYRGPLTDALAEAGVSVRLSETAPDPAAVDVIVYAPGALDDFSPFTGLKAVLNLWAGVEKVLPVPGLTAPLCRMVDPAMTEGMTEYVVTHVLRHHMSTDLDLARQDGVWRKRSVPIARERHVTVLGLGELGQAAAGALAALNFRVTGWSRSPREVPGVICRAGEGGLEAALATAEILVTLLPHTPETESLLDVRRLGMLPRGAVIVNPGRGALIDEAALIAALDDGHIAHATLDVFRTEPLPPGHPFWAHPGVTVTPHIAAETRPVTASRVIAENIRRIAAGEPLLYQVDRDRGY